MNKRLLILCAGILVVGIVGALLYINTRPQPPSTEYQVRSVVYGLGDELSRVSLVGKPDVIAQEMDQHYAVYVHPDLLLSWKNKPLSAPGRLATAAVPDRIEIQTLTLNGDGTYTAVSQIVSSSGKVPVRFVLSQGPDGWQITEYTQL